MSQNVPKIAIFQFWINRPNRLILMICKSEKVSITFFDHNLRYWTCNPHIRWKIAFFEVKCHFWAFSHKCKNRFFVEYSTGVEISTVKFCEKKLMTLVDIHHKYLEVTLITYENIQKANCVTFFSTSQYVTNYLPKIEFAPPGSTSKSHPRTSSA